MENRGFALFEVSLTEFITFRPNQVVGELAKELARKFPDISSRQVFSWQSQIEHLQDAITELLHNVDNAKSGRILLEYSIPVLRRRIDAVLLLNNHVIVIEYKAGSSTSPLSALRQAQDYAIDIRSFHEPSKNKRVSAIAVGDYQETLLPEYVCDFSSFDSMLIELAKEKQTGGDIEIETWSSGRYFPIPNVIQAAVAAFNGHSVREIAMAKADPSSLERTSIALKEAVRTAMDTGSKIFCALTGVPGAGKTLAGLNAVSEISSNLKIEFDQAVYLSGNAPLVNVLREALYRDRKPRDARTTKKSIEPLIQEMHRFVEDSYDSNKAPNARVIVFDEAQRAWTLNRNLKKFGRNLSEPDMVLSLMNRHDGWAVIVALIGGGQEIHSGEAGLGAWGEALLKHSHWKIWASPNSLSGLDLASTKLFDSEVPDDILITKDLHLDVSIRSINSTATSRWVNLTLEAEKELANNCAKGDFPIFVTRNLSHAKSWLRKSQEGTLRVGLLASSGAARIRALGVEQPTYNFLQGIDYIRWFLDGREDVRSSYQLEVAMSEFEVQGLELDYTCLIWDADLIFENGAPIPRRFSGGQWRSIEHKSSQYIETLNRYRVLMTRFRNGMVICVPNGDEQDPTRKRAYYDSVYDHLIECGARRLPSFDTAE